MNQSIAEVKSYYDKHVASKLKGFVEVNARAERAWLTIEQWTQKNPQRILEVGCGIGDICWRMTRRWPESEVVGLDVSPKSLEIARKLFGSSRLSFVEGPLIKGKVIGKFDLIVLMDVYEHIAVADRSALHEALRELRSDGGRIVLAFPTPSKQANLRQCHPDQIQPVDEDIDLATILALAGDIKAEVLLYQEVNVWHEGDYAHAVLGKHNGWNPAANNRGIKAKLRQRLLGKAKPHLPSRSQRLALVHQRLGIKSYPG